jgi:trans-2,3-dihydro-3-hydroxyanthranilate isomerase
MNHDLTRPLDFAIVDVFAATRYAGNQLAVFTNAADLTTVQMQQIAQEVNFSETTFILGGNPTDGYAVRIFTPMLEVPFAGHPTLGTAYVLQRQVIQSAIAQITLNFPIGPIAVQFDYDPAGQVDQLWMQQLAPQFGPTFTPIELAAVLGIEPSEIDQRWPIQVVSTGLPCIIVPLRSLSTLQRLKVDRGYYYNLIAKTEAKAILAFCPETTAPDRQFSVRMFADALGVAEDPATGSANGCFAGYLVEHQYLGSAPVAVRVEQGAAIGRPSVLDLRAQRLGAGIDIAVGGQVILVAQGQFV